MSVRDKSAIYEVWKYSYILPGTQLTLRGHSRGSEKSCFYISELKLFFDAGIQSYYNPNFIFITHCHSDHSFQLPMIITGLKHTPQIYSPSESRHLFQNFLRVTYQLRKGTTRVSGHYQVRGAYPGDEIDLKKQGYFVRVYDLKHNVPTRGYGLCQRRKKLNPRFLGLGGHELRKLKEGGIDINVYVEHKILAYILDTNISCFSMNPELLEYKYVIVECTFFRDEDMEDTDSHIHWNNLKPIVMNNPQVNFILVHFSMRYSWEEIEKFFEGEKEGVEELKNMMVWMN